VETVCAHYKRRANIKTYTTLYSISVLLVSTLLHRTLFTHTPHPSTHPTWRSDT
jgi:hypothetical protein